MEKIVVATLLWDANQNSQAFSSMYDESWVEKLYAGVKRNLTLPFDFVLFTDRERDLSFPCEQYRISADVPDYGSCIEPYKMGRPMILMGLDTIITGNIDHLAEYCLSADNFALPLDPYNDQQVCNGVALVPAGFSAIGYEWNGENDMEWVRRYDPDVIDVLFPDQVVSYKGHVKAKGLGDARIVYFHGDEKPHQINEAWVRANWSTDHAEADGASETKENTMADETPPMSGWKERQAGARRRSARKAELAELRAGRAAHRAKEAAMAAAQEEKRLKAMGTAPEPKPRVDEAPDDLGEFADMDIKDLRALYEKVTGKKATNFLKAPALVEGIREALAGGAA